ncbi:MAG: flagellar motor switch protein FliG [Paracoccaceae bacterium]
MVPVPNRPAPDKLTRPQKAAIIIRLLLNEDAAPDLRSLGLAPLRNVVRTMATLGDVSRPTLIAVVEEFLRDLGDFGLSLRGSLEETVSVLKGHVTEDALDRLRDETEEPPDTDLWEMIAGIDAEALAGFLGAEHPQVAAVVLSKLPAETAACVLAHIDEETARDIIVAITRTSGIDAAAVEAIARAIHAHFNAASAPRACSAAPAERIGGIMNFTPSEARDRLLRMFEAEDPETASQVRRVMFTFPDIPARVVPRDVAKLVRAVEQDTLIRALAGAQKQCPAVKDFILENLTTRLSQQLSEELEEAGEIRDRDAEAAMTAVIAAIRALADAGEIELQSEEED